MSYLVINCVLEGEEGAYTASVEIDGICFTMAETLKELETNMREALVGHLEVSAKVLEVAEIRFIPFAELELA
jgi:predicted RNase H-like HicB family nuclease